MSNDINDYKKGPKFGPFIFLVDKNQDESSFDIIRKFKRIFGKRLGKIGHFGTLDPFATGLMIIGIGGSTRLNQFTEDHTKEYIATGILGKKSSTGDLTAPEDEIILDENFKSIDSMKLEEAFNSFLGEYWQAPHSYSAAKHEGKKLYEWAREGKIIEKEKVKRHIHEIEVLSIDGPQVTFRVLVSHGTYIRVLMEDVAQKLGTYGVLSELRRSKIGHLDVEKALLSSEIHSENIENILISAQSVKGLADFPSIDLDDHLASRYSNGQRLRVENSDQNYWVVASNKIYGLGQVREGVLSSLVNFQPPAEFSIN